MAPTMFEMIYAIVFTVSTIVATFIAIRNYNISERIRIFGHE